MKYLCLVYLDQEHWNACPDATCAEYAQQLVESRRMLAAEPLHPTHTATTVRVRNRQVSLYDGPFAETQEQLAGFYLPGGRGGSQRGNSHWQWNPPCHIWQRGSTAGAPADGGTGKFA